MGLRWRRQTVASRVNAGFAGHYQTGLAAARRGTLPFRASGGYNADMSPAAAPVYDPLNVYKPFGPNIGIVDGPLEYFTTAGVRLPLPFSTRMTVVRLQSGDLFLHSPIAFDAKLAEELQAMGTVRHLVSPNQFHYAHIG